MRLYKGQEQSESQSMNLKSFAEQSFECRVCTESCI